MPFAQIYILEGRTEEQKRAVIEKVTQALNHPSQRGLWKAGWGQGTKFADFTDGLSNTLLVSEVLTINEEAVGAPKENVRVWIHDVPKENWGIAGVSAKSLGR